MWFSAPFIVSTLIAVLASQPASPTDLIKQARKLNADGKHAEAITLYREAVQRSPGLFDAHYGLGIVLDLEGQFDEAHREFARAIELAAPDEKDQAMLGAAVSFVFDGNAKDAAILYRRVFDGQMAAESYGGAGEIANALGRVYLETGDLDNALKWYQTGHDQAVRQRDLPPQFQDLFAMRWAHAQARIAARRGDATTARAQVAAAKAILDKGTNPDEKIQYPYLEGYVSLFLKKDADAIAELQAADQRDPFIQFLLAQAYEHSGDDARARAAYEKVLSSNAHSLNNAFARAAAKKKISERSPGHPLAQQ